MAVSGPALDLTLHFAKTSKSNSGSEQICASLPALPKWMTALKHRLCHPSQTTLTKHKTQNKQDLSEYNGRMPKLTNYEPRKATRCDLQNFFGMDRHIGP